MLIFRFFCREIFAVVSVIVLVVLAILLMSQAAVYLSDITYGKVAVGFFGRFMLINIPFLISYVLPFAFYFGLLFAYGRFYAESEMVVMQAAGFSNGRLFFYSMIMAIMVMVIVATLVFVVNPIVMSERGKILRYSKTHILQTIIPGQFKVLNEGKLIVYASKATHDRTRLQNIFLAQLNETTEKPSGNRWTVNFATEAYRTVHDNSDVYLQTRNGHLYKGIPGGLDYHIVSYKDYSYLLEGNTISGEYHRLDGMPTTQLWLQRGDILALSEFEWRVSLVLQVLILTLFAIPLSRVQPRQGRYAKFLPAVLFYLVYVNMLFIAKYLLENNIASTRLGLWWAHGCMLIIISMYYAKVSYWSK